MKTTIISVLFALLASTSATHLEVLAGAGDLPPSAIPDIITGYMDGLLGVSLKGQVDNCDYFITHAQKTFEDAVDLFYQANDFWMPIPTKIGLFIKGVVKIMGITLQIIKDLGKCNLGDDAIIVDKWSREHPNFMSVLSTVGGNMLKHMFGMTSKVMNAITDINDKNYYGFGKDIGDMANMMLGDK